VACVLINRIDRSMASILSEFLEEEMTVERIEEPAALPVRHYHAAWEATTGEAGTREAFGKVWIDGIGYMRDGRRLRDGREKADSRKLYRDRTVYQAFVLGREEVGGPLAGRTNINILRCHVAEVLLAEAPCRAGRYLRAPA
jgi:hypothetical protein